MSSALERSLNGANRTQLTKGGRNTRDQGDIPGPVGDILVHVMDLLRANTARIDAMAAAQEIVNRAAVDGGANMCPLPSPRHARPKPKRQLPDGWHVYHGGRAALVPLVLAAGPLAGRMLLTFIAGRAAWRSQKAALAASALILGFAGMAATPSPVTDYDPPAHRAAVVHQVPRRPVRERVMVGPSDYAHTSR